MLDFKYKLVISASVHSFAEDYGEQSCELGTVGPPMMNDALVPDLESHLSSRVDKGTSSPYAMLLLPSLSL